MPKLPYIQFYPLDWLRDTRRLSPQAKAAWIDILALAWNEPKRGVYERSISAMKRELGIEASQVSSIIDELEQVADVQVDGETVLVMSRRMKKDESKREYERKKKMWQREKGDVPNLSPKCPPIVPQEKLEVRSQKLEVRDVNVKGKRSIAPKFKKPTPEEIAAYAKSEGLSLNAQHFFDYYESNGWKVSRNPMKNWQATARNWGRRDKHGTGTTHVKLDQSDPKRVAVYES